MPVASKSGLASGLPGASSSDPVRCPRLQLRGSAGFSPASLSLSSERNARTQYRKQSECNWFDGRRQSSAKKLGEVGFARLRIVNIMTIMTIMTIIAPGGEHERR